MAKEFNDEEWMSDSSARGSQPATMLSAGVVAENLRAAARERIDEAMKRGKPGPEDAYRDLNRSYGLEQIVRDHFEPGGSEFDFSKRGEDEGTGTGCVPTPPRSRRR